MWGLVVGGRRALRAAAEGRLGSVVSAVGSQPEGQRVSQRDLGIDRREWERESEGEREGASSSPRGPPLSRCSSNDAEMVEAPGRRHAPPNTPPGHPLDTHRYILKRK